MPKKMATASLANLTSSGNNKRRRYSYNVLARITRKMQSGQFTINALSKACNVSWGSASRWVTAMHRAGCIHVIEYTRTPFFRMGERVFEWGPGRDVPKPTPMSSSETMARHRQKVKVGTWRGLVG